MRIRGGGVGHVDDAYERMRDDGMFAVGSMGVM